MQGPKTPAVAQFRRQIAYLVLAGLVSVPAALAYLASYGPVSIALALAVTFGVFVSIVLGGGLMAAGFYSSASGLDDVVAAAHVEPAGTAALGAATVAVQPIPPLSEVQQEGSLL
ncbi:hypothetical protein [Polymorphobacter megasporae]|uniref:hypothetical protein n=1 Tax=Glacieibacterium megasporae TaxID=2835787 RepID=UPI001C1E3CA0|nr:hypothetical protein [Polymorphobacter megasporae]UAJ12464.1 hypothetical protein KTC28_21910 [Polymorphobacter megasporae]